MRECGERACACVACNRSVAALRMPRPHTPMPIRYNLWVIRLSVCVTSHSLSLSPLPATPPRHRFPAFLSLPLFHTHTQLDPCKQIASTSRCSRPSWVCCRTRRRGSMLPHASPLRLEPQIHNNLHACARTHTHTCTHIHMHFDSQAWRRVMSARRLPTWHMHDGSLGALCSYRYDAKRLRVCIMKHHILPN